MHLKGMGLFIIGRKYWLQMGINQYMRGFIFFAVVKFSTGGYTQAGEIFLGKTMHCLGEELYDTGN